MCIDHCIVSKKLAERISLVDITGYGSERNGFMGIECSPLLIKLDTEKEFKVGGAEAEENKKHKQGWVQLYCQQLLSQRKY